MRKFDTRVVAEMSAPPKAKPAAKIPDSPPFVTGYDDDETKRIKAFLLKQFDLKISLPAEEVKKAAPAKKGAKPNAKAKKAPAAKKPKVSVKDLLLRKFATGALKTSKSPYKAEMLPKIPAAPPFVTGYDDDETKRMKASLLKQFDLKTSPPEEEVKKAETIQEAAETMSEVFERPKYQPPASVLTGGPNPMAKAIKFGLCGLAMLLVIIVGASMSNRAKFHLKNADGAVQLQRGKFAPSGTELVMSLDGMEMPSPIRDVYSEEEVYAVVSDYFQKKADAALNEPGGPDFAKIKRYLHQATLYAPTKELRDLAQLRLKSMNFLVLLLNADVALTRGTLPDLQAAKSYLGKAGTYASMDYQRKLLVERQAVVDRMIDALKAE
ncbi:MAG: hypothetical protein JRJ17_04270 [Deltaproteobacteria bacterium]|nr:hypothetical protein [Deltaproteobacteria bacterium]